MDDYMKRNQTIQDIMNYMILPKFGNRYKTFTNRFDILIIAEDSDAIDQLLAITDCQETPLTEDILLSFQEISSDRILLIPENSLEQFINDILSF